MAKISPQDRDMMIRTVMGEAGQESDLGKAGVASVILNRVKTGRWGSTPSEVVLSQGQFEPWQTRRAELLSYRPDSPAYKKAANIVDKVLEGKVPDVTEGATHFFSPKAMLARGAPPPQWANKDTYKGVIGGHQFYAPEGSVDSVPIADWVKQQGGGGEAPAVEPAAAPAPTPAASSALKPTSPLDSFQVEMPVEEAGPPVPITATLSPLDQFPTEEEPKPALEVAQAAAPKGILSAKEGDSWLKSAGKAVATAGIKGLGDVVGTMGNVRELLNTAGTAIGNKTLGPERMEKVRELNRLGAEVEQGLPAWAQANPLGTAYENAPTGEEVTNPILAKTGEYVPESFLGKVGMAGTRALAGSALSGGGPAQMLGSAIAGGTAEGVSEATGSPLLGMVAGVAAPGMVGRSTNALLGRSSSLTPETQRLAKTLVDSGVDLAAPQMAGKGATSNVAYNVMGQIAGGNAKRQEQMQQFAGAIGDLVGIPKGTEITPRVLTARLKDIGKTMGNIESQVNLPLDQSFAQRLQGAVSGFTSVLPAEQQQLLRKNINKIVDAAKANGGVIPGRVYGDLMGANSPLSKLAKQGDSLGDYARGVKTVLRDHLEANIPPDMAQAYRTAREQYSIAKTLEPEVLTGEIGQFRPTAVDKAVNTHYGSIDDTRPENIQKLKDLTAAGTMFLQEPKDSGTALRHLVLRGLGGAGGAGASLLVAPAAALPAAAGALAGGAGMYGAARGGRALLDNPLARNALLRGSTAPMPRNPLLPGATVAPYFLGASQ